MAEDPAARLFKALISCDPGDAIAVIESVRSSGVPQDRIFDAVFVPAMSMLGGAWAEGSVGELELAQSAVVAEQITSFVVPSVPAKDTGVTILIGTVHRDEHSIAKNIIGAALKEAGNRVVDLGVSVRPSEFLERLEETGAKIIVVTAESIATAEECVRVRESLNVAGHEGVMLLVSGGPFTADPGLARRIGANGLITSAEGAIKVVSRMMRDRLGGEA
ncbi:MAG: cobalamin-dependent protein [Actinobacteria bacterium]|nr:cobalamin-dependent protein [Actinomycetota bacterium]